MKKLVMVAVALLLAMASAMAKEAKHYSDRTNGYGGVVGARFEAPIMTFNYAKAECCVKKDLKKQGYVITRPLKKLSKEEVFLVWNAVCEYDVLDGEVYSVFAQCENSGEYLCLDVEICNNGKSFRNYGGFYYKEK